jgi:hypothetical protein
MTSTRTFGDLMRWSPAEPPAEPRASQGETMSGHRRIRACIRCPQTWPRMSPAPCRGDAYPCDRASYARQWSCQAFLSIRRCTMASVSFWHLLDQGFKRAHFHLQALDLRQYELPSTGLATGAQFGFSEPWNREVSSAHLRRQRRVTSACPAAVFVRHASAPRQVPHVGTGFGGSRPIPGRDRQCSCRVVP